MKKYLIFILLIIVVFVSGNEKQAMATGAFESVSTGRYNVYVIKNDGTAWALGDNNYGQIGNGTAPVDAKIITKILGLPSNIVQIKGGYLHGLALTSDGFVYSWGSNTDGQLGDNTIIQKNTAVQVKNNDGTGFLTNIRFIGAGLYNSYAIDNNGEMWVWGKNSNNQISGLSTSDILLPIKYNISPGVPMSNIDKVSAGENHTVVLTKDKKIYTTGDSINGEIGNGTTTSSNTLYPYEVVSLPNIIKVSSGRYFNLALDETGGIWFWGDNEQGQAGNGTIANIVMTPTNTFGLNNVLDMEAGDYTAYLKRSDGYIWGSGINDQGQLGINSIVTPKPLIEKVLKTDGSCCLENIQSFAANKDNFVGLDSSGKVWVSGDGTQGQIGINTTSDTMVPRRVLLDFGVIIPSEINFESTIINQQNLSVKLINNIPLEINDFTGTFAGWNLELSFLPFVRTDFSQLQDSYLEFNCSDPSYSGVIGVTYANCSTSPMTIIPDGTKYKILSGEASTNSSGVKNTEIRKEDLTLFFSSRSKSGNFQSEMTFHLTAGP
jgi:alpha-tubulin suppressor-like RCC1 family protein